MSVTDIPKRLYDQREAEIHDLRSVLCKIRDHLESRDQLMKTARPTEGYSPSEDRKLYLKWIAEQFTKDYR